ncbi:MAG: hypothetical protein EBR95_04025 [Verrucomicrobia bacterium]|nr:hypothetical protein [Verrucomicrobiota bacterium]
MKASTRPIRPVFLILLVGLLLPLAAAAAEKLEARIGRHQGHGVIFVNGRPIAPQMYSGTEHSRQTWTGRARQSIEEFTAQGYRIIQTDFWLKYSLRADGSLDVDGIRRQLRGILDVNPEAMIVARINVSAPSWWLDANPGERCKVTATEGKTEAFGGNRMESLASDRYAQFAERHLRAFIREVAALPEGDRVIGFHLGGGVYGEWHYYGIYNEPDASAPMAEKFRAYARRRHGSLDAINKAWKTAFSSLDEIAVPTFARRHQVADGDLRDPREDRFVIDYYDCQQKVLSALVTRLAGAIKETWPRPGIVGVFYGYFYGGFTVGAQASQLDVETLFRSPHVDYFSGPYASRNMLGSGVPRTLTQSVRLNGKLWMTEHDGGSHLRDNDKMRFPDIPRNEAESVARMRRNFMHGLAEDAGQWWYDFGPGNKTGGWGTPVMLAEAKGLLALANDALRRPYEKPSDVLVVHDMRSFLLTRPAVKDRLTPKITEALTDSLLGTGAAVDHVFLMDLAAVDLARYRLVIFGNTFLLDAQQRAFIKERVMTPGRTVVFMSAAGYCDGETNSTTAMSDLTGMRIAKTTDSADGVAVRLAGESAELDARGVSSRFAVADPGARSLGAYASAAVVAAEKDVRGCRVLYFGVPLKTSLAAMKALLREAGVRSYVSGTVERDYAVIGGGLICVYSVNGGLKTIHPLNGAPREVPFGPVSARYFDLQTGEPLLLPKVEQK